MILAIKEQKAFFDGDYKVHQRLVRIDWLQIDFSPQRHAFTHFFFHEIFFVFLHETLLLLLQESAFQYYQMSLGVAGQGKFPFRIFFYYFLARLFPIP